MNKNNHSEFWSEFACNAVAWASSFRAGRQQQVFEEIDGLFESSGYPFCFDITETGGECNLIISPEGDHAVAALIDTLLESSPLIPGWRILGRRQKKELTDVRAIIQHLYLVDPLQCQYQIMEREHTVIEMFVPDNADLTPEEQRDSETRFFGMRSVKDL